LIGEITRRTDVVGIFPHEAAIARLINGAAARGKRLWAVGRRYLTLEILAPFGHINQLRLPAVAA
jgi:hemolysin-activating ACP:hemolysin acyltransferase